MKPVMQDTQGRRGNCMSACLASILEIPLASVPNFYEVAGEGVGEWWAALRAWLKPHGFGIITLTFTDAAQWDQLCLDGYHIVSGPSPRVEGSFHATVWHAGRMAHDPHPDQSGIVAPETLDMLYPLDAGALRTPGVRADDAAAIEAAAREAWGENYPLEAQTFARSLDRIRAAGVPASGAADKWLQENDPPAAGVAGGVQAPAALRLPEPRKLPKMDSSYSSNSTYFRGLGWNECLDEVKRLNALGVGGTPE